jgi:phytoene synthase
VPHDRTRALAIPKVRPGSDLAACHEILVRGSRSFWVASWLLPRRMRAPAAAFYAFCRAADDLVDDGDPARGLEILRRRVDAIFAGRPHDHPADRAFSTVVHLHAIPRATIDALLEGFQWDAESRTYETLDDVLAYGVRVASSVGVVMTLLMGRRDHATLARACDLGAAMQLTNIARDVGEDARRGRLYLPLSWLHAARVDLDAFLSAPTPSEPVRAATLRLLDEADRLYARAHAGIDMLPADCRPAIRAASAIYRDIGRVIRRRGGDGITGRARVSGLRKLWLVGRAAFATPSASPTPDLAAPPLAPAAALVEAVARLDRRALPSRAPA